MTDGDFPSFLDALKAHMGRSGDDVTTLARRAGVNRDALYKVVYGKTKTPKLELIVRVAAAYGETVEEFMGLSKTQIRDDLLAEIAQLNPSERAVLLASLRALRPQPHDDAEGTAPT